MHHKLKKMYHLFGSYKKIAYLCTEFDKNVIFRNNVT